MKKNLMKKYNLSCLNPNNQPGIIAQRMNKQFLEDWGKMNIDKYTIMKHSGGLFTIFEDGKLLPVLDGQPIVDALNEQNTMIKVLKDGLDESQEIIGELKKENKELKLLRDSLKKENQEQKELINLIADADSFTKEESVKEILRYTIKGIDSVAGEFAAAWHDYCILSTFFKEHYKEHWDNYD